MRDGSYSRGFTLFELLLVIALVAVLAALSLPVSERFLTHAGVRDAASLTESLVRLARARAASGSEDGSWGVHVTTSSATLFKGADFSGRDAVFDNTVSFTGDVSVSGDTEVIFTQPRGTPAAARSFTFSGSGVTRTILVNEEGSTTIQ